VGVCVFVVLEDWVLVVLEGVSLVVVFCSVSYSDTHDGFWMVYVVLSVVVVNVNR